MGLAAVCGALAFTSCANDDSPVGEARKAGAKPTISFSPVAGNVKGTRGTATTPDNYLTQIAFSVTTSDWTDGTAGDIKL